MTSREFISARLNNQQITGTLFKKPSEIVSWFAAMQAQEYAMAKWAIGLRLTTSIEQEIEDCFNKGEIIRTHVLRPTWHFVSPQDIRWMLKLSAPRVHAFNAYYYRKRELDAKIFNRSHRLIAKALEGGNHLTRSSLQDVLTRARIPTDGERLGTIMMHAELEGLICSGPRSGKQFTYALLDERVAPAKAMSREEALTTLMGRYLKSRGPATLHDFIWWSGLTMKDARDAVSMLGHELKSVIIDENNYFLIGEGGNASSGDKSSATFLMPDYDEYGIGYRDRSAIIEAYNGSSRSENPVFNRMIVVDGRIVGSWRPTVSKHEVAVETSFFNPPSKTKVVAVKKAIRKYEKFVLGL